MLPGQKVDIGILASGSQPETEESQVVRISEDPMIPAERKMLV
jgi:hypothetical protein